MKAKPLFFSLLFVMFSACSNLWKTPEKQEVSEPEVLENKPLKQATSASKLPSKGARSKLAAAGTTELYWQVPGEPVEWYHIYYGPSPSNMTQHIAVKTVDLEKFPSETYGAVFRYQLAVPTNETVYLKIISENRFGKSGDSQLIKIYNGKQEAVKQ